MTIEEVNAIFSLADTNKDGKLDYAEVSCTSFIQRNSTDLMMICSKPVFIQCCILTFI